jgi:hypothetical protein
MFDFDSLRDVRLCNPACIVVMSAQTEFGFLGYGAGGSQHPPMPVAGQRLSASQGRSASRPLRHDLVVQLDAGEPGTASSEIIRRGSDGEVAPDT